jgi:hypothetical protein
MPYLSRRLLLLASFLIFTAPPGTGAAQTLPRVEYQYAAKFVCGRAPAVTPQGYGLVAPGRYFTAINVHNPARAGRLAFRKKFAVALPRERAGRVTRFFDAELAADEAFNVDCGDIYAHTQTPPGQFLEGFAVFESRAELDVVAVYTAGALTGQVETMHSERVPGRTFASRCGDLDLDVGTGRAPWVVTPPGASASVPVFDFTGATAPLPLPWDNTLPGTNWVGPAANAYDTAGGGRYEYKLCFCLCENYASPSLTLEVLSDNEASVSLNGVPLFNVPNSSWSSPWKSRFFDDPKLFRQGENCLTVTVRNEPDTPTALDVRGRVTAPGGGCPAEARPPRR